MNADYDPDQRRAAVRIGQRHPSWVVMWGAASRLFWAFGRFNTARPVIVTAASPQELLTRMQQAELAASPGAHPPPG